MRDYTSSSLEVNIIYIEGREPGKKGGEGDGDTAERWETGEREEGRGRRKGERQEGKMKRRGGGNEKRTTSPAAKGA